MDEIQQSDESQKPEHKKLPWDKLEGEPDKAHFYFACYLYYGRSRSLAKTAKTLNISPSTLSKCAKKWKWEERASMLDQLYYHLEEKDYLLEMQVDKENVLRLKSDVSEHAYHALQFLSQFLRDFWSTYENPQVLKKLKFVNTITRSISKLYKLIDLPFDDYVQQTRCERNMEISKLLSLDGYFTPIADEILCAYKEIKDNKSLMRKPKDSHHYDDYGRFDTADSPGYKPRPDGERDYNSDTVDNPDFQNDEEEFNEKSEKDEKSES